MIAPAMLRPAVFLAMLTAAGSGSRLDVTLTQVDRTGAEIGPSHTATCDAARCVAVLPVAFAQGVCIVAFQISPPDLASIISFDASAVTCISAGSEKDLLIDLVSPPWARLGRNRVISQVVELHLSPAMHDFAPADERPSLIRVDAVFPPRT